jgi:iron complex outermembrane receptor protein
LLIDGIPATTPDGQGQGSSISLTSTERIEVLRGPLALMYGNSSGGVIQAFTRDAPEQAAFDAQLYTGSFGLQRTDWQVAGRVGGYGLVADYSTFDIDGNRANSRAERQQFNGKLSFDAFEKTRVNVVFNQFDMPLAQDPLGLDKDQMAADPTQAGTNSTGTKTASDFRVRKTVLQNQLGTSIKHEIDSDRSVTARLYYGTRNNLQYQVGTASGPNVNGAWTGLARNYYGTGLQFNAKTNLGATPVNWVAAYEFDRSSEARQAGTAKLGEKTSLTRDEVNQSDNSDGFIQGSALVSEKVSLLAGLRYSTVSFASDDIIGNGKGSGATRYQSSSPVLGVTYHANENLNLYANYGKGFETPTLSEMAYKNSGSPPPEPAFNTALNASSSEHYEWGAKWSPSASSRLDFTMYQINTTDEIVVDVSNAGKTAYINAAGTTRTGWELSGHTLLTPHIRATLAASQIDAQYKYISPSLNSAIVAGNKLPGIPQSFLFSELLWSDQKANAGKQGKALGSQAGLELTQAGRLFANDTNTASAEGYTTLNLKASHGWALGSGSMTAYARIDNLADERYVGSVIVNQAALQFYEPAPGRNWTLGLRLTLPL